MASTILKLIEKLPTWANRRVPEIAFLMRGLQKGDGGEFHFGKIRNIHQRDGKGSRSQPVCPYHGLRRKTGSLKDSQGARRFLLDQAAALFNGVCWLSDPATGWLASSAQRALVSQRVPWPSLGPCH